MNLREYVSAIALDSCGGKDCEKKDKQAVLDAIAENAARLKAAAAVQAWAEAEEEEDYPLADQFIDLMVDAADIDMDDDGELSDEENEMLDVSLAEAEAYLGRFGVKAEDFEALVDGDDQAAKRVHDLIVDELPDGEKGEADIEEFAFAEGENESVLDSTTRMDYSKHMRNGGKTKVGPRRIVKRTGKAKNSARKNAKYASKFSHTPSANRKRRLSLAKGRRLGFYKKRR